MLDNRLKACANYIRKDAKMCDVGTDHAYLPCYLIKHDIASFCYAVDVNQMPLDSAIKTVNKYGYSDKISTLLSDGLSAINEGEVDDIVIAGMGGELIARIVLDYDWLKNENINLILQPMTNSDFLRATLYENGFEIKEETPVHENGHHYSIMLCSYTGVSQEISDVFAVLGKVPEKNNDSSKEYIKYQHGRFSKIVDGLQKSNNKDSLLYFSKLVEEMEKFL